MTSFGRGRGWYLQNREQGLRRPGGTFCSNDVVKDILNKLSSCDQVTPQLIQEIIDLLTNPTNKESLRETCNLLWKQSILNNTFTTKLVMIFSDNKVAFIEDSNNTIRTHFLHFLQDNYMSREKNKMEDKKTFANIVSLHAEVYYHMRLSNGNKLKILAEPLVHYLEDLIQNSVEENIHFIMVQLLRSGKDLCTACPKQLEEFMMTIRQALLKENSDHSRNRAVLLLLVELANSNYEIKDITSDTHLKQFYTSNIKSLIFDYPFYKEELKASSEIENDNNSPKNLRQVDNMPSHRISKEEANEVCNKQSHSKGLHIPRAIRGTGGLDTKREDDVNTKLSSMKITSRQKNADFWDHDDRFHKDYE